MFTQCRVSGMTSKEIRMMILICCEMNMKTIVVKQLDKKDKEIANILISLGMRKNILNSR